MNRRFIVCKVTNRIKFPCSKGKPLNWSAAGGTSPVKAMILINGVTNLFSFLLLINMLVINVKTIAQKQKAV